MREAKEICNTSCLNVLNDPTFFFFLIIRQCLVRHTEDLQKISCAFSIMQKGERLLRLLVFQSHKNWVTGLCSVILVQKQPPACFSNEIVTNGDFPPLL